MYDERLGDYYLEIWGTLDNGYSIILRTPIQGIKDNVNISTTLIKYVGGAILTSWNNFSICGINIYNKTDKAAF